MILANLSITASPAAKVELVSVTDGVQVASNMAQKSSLSFFDLFFQADLIVQSVIILLIVASVISWTIIIDKITTFAKMNYAMNKFEKRFWSGDSLDALFKRVIARREYHPLAQVFIAAMQEWDSDDKSGAKQIKERMLNAMYVANMRSAESMGKNLGFLATVSSSTPFIGLFGTVWGIMSSFQAIAISNNTTLAVVAPGIAEALLATAIGLAVAIPAAIFYNKFSNDINRLSGKVESFVLELSNLISKELEKLR